MEELKDEQQWFFLVPLLDLAFPVYLALVTALNHVEPSPQRRMRKFISYIRNHFEVKEKPFLLFGYRGWKLTFSCNSEPRWLKFYEIATRESKLTVFLSKSKFLIWNFEPLEWEEFCFLDLDSVYYDEIVVTREEFFDSFYKSSIITRKSETI